MLLPIALDTAQRPHGNNCPQEETAGAMAPEEFDSVLASIRVEAQEDPKTAETETKVAEEQLSAEGEKESLEEGHQDHAFEAVDAPGIDEELRELGKTLSDTLQAQGDTQAKALDSALPEDKKPPLLFTGAEGTRAPLPQIERGVEQIPALLGASSQPPIVDPDRRVQQLAQSPSVGSPLAATTLRHEQACAIGSNQTKDIPAPTSMENLPSPRLQQATISSPSEAMRSNVLDPSIEKAPENLRDASLSKIAGQGLSTDARGIAPRAAPEHFVQTAESPPAREKPDAVDGLRRAPAVMKDLKDAEFHGRLMQAERAAPLTMTDMGREPTPVIAFANDKVASSIASVASSEAAADALASRITDGGLFLPDKPFLPVNEPALQARMTGYAPVLPGDHGASVARQVADMVRITPGGVVDVSLRPDELGAVRLSMKAVEGQMTVIVQADRSDTLDLMRRNIEGLSQEFRELGYDSITFSFQSGGDNQHDQQQGHNFVAGGGEDTHLTNRAEDQRVLLVGSGLDIRI